MLMSGEWDQNNYEVNATLCLHGRTALIHAEIKILVPVISGY